MKKFTYNKLFIFCFTIIYLILPKYVFGAIGAATGCDTSGTLKDCMPKLYTAAISIGGGLAVLMFIWAGYDYISSGGEVEKINKAKEKVVAAFSGLLLLVLAYLIVDALS